VNAECAQSIPEEKALRINARFHQFEALFILRKKKVCFSKKNRHPSLDSSSFGLTILSNPASPSKNYAHRKCFG